METMFERYQTAFTNHNRVNNSQKQMDSIFQGSKEYLKSLKNCISSETILIESNENKDKFEFLTKINKELQCVH